MSGRRMATVSTATPTHHSLSGFDISSEFAAPSSAVTADQIPRAHDDCLSLLGFMSPEDRQAKVKAGATDAKLSIGGSTKAKKKAKKSKAAPAAATSALGCADVGFSRNTENFPINGVTMIAHVSSLSHTRPPIVQTCTGTSRVGRIRKHWW